MMTSVVLLLLAVVGVFAAWPLTNTFPIPLSTHNTMEGRGYYPRTSLSRAFRLVVNVTDPAKDFDLPIQNTYISSIHVGAGLALVGNIQDPENSRIFYENGTAREQRQNQSSVITDGGTPMFPSGIRLAQDKGSNNFSTAHLDAGPGSRGIGLSISPEPYVFLRPETWLACNESLAYYQNQFFIVFKQSTDEKIHDRTPQTCVPVRLIPECALLNELPPGSYSNHDYALVNRCYIDVKAIEWSKYRS